MSNIQNTGDGQSSIVEYGSYDLAAAEEEFDRLNRTGGQFLTLKEGRNIVRVLPPPVGRSSPFVETWQHFIEVAGLPDAITFNCPRQMAQTPCPACWRGDQLKRSGNPADVEASKDFWPTRRTFCCCIDRTAEAEGPKILGFGKQIHMALSSLRKDPDVGGDFTHPEHGFDIIIERVGTGKRTSYTVHAARQTTPLGNNDWIMQQPDLKHLLNVPTLDQIRAMAKGEKRAAMPANFDPNKEFAGLPF